MTSLFYLESAMQDKLGLHDSYEHVNVASLLYLYVIWQRFWDTWLVEFSVNHYAWNACMKINKFNFTCFKVKL